MLFMVIEHFKSSDAAAIYQRFREKGRMLPEGLKYIDSWTAETFDRCFQLMECQDIQLFNNWIAQWEDLVEFEIIQVLTSKEANNLIKEGF